MSSYYSTTDNAGHGPNALLYAPHDCSKLKQRFLNPALNLDLNLFEPDRHITHCFNPLLDSIDLSLNGDQLILRGERKTTQTGEKMNYHRKEREEGMFRRVVNLATRVDADRVEAVSKNGVLTIKIAKAEEVKPRQVAIQTE